MCKHSKHRKLLTIDQVPRYLRYNYYIRSGYRHPADMITSSGYHLLLSTFSWHNESVNIWTHLFALILFGILMIHELCSEHIRWYVLVSCCSCVATFYGSIIYHSGMNKCQCQKDYNQCLNYDVKGVLFSLTFTGISPIVHGYKCNYNILVMLALVLLFCSMGYVSMMVLKDTATAKIRGKYIAIHAILRISLGLLCVSGNMIWHQQYDSSKWHALSAILLIVGGGINVSRYPEKLFVNQYVSSFFLVKREKLRRRLNGTGGHENNEIYHELLDGIRYSIDYIGNSHQIWHIFVILSCVCAYYGGICDDLYFEDVNIICGDEPKRAQFITYGMY